MDERNQLGDLNVDGRIILRLIAKVGCGDVHWIHPAQDMNQWLALINRAIHFRIPKKVANIWPS
jgi:hypothetical protein